MKRAKSRSHYGHSPDRIQITPVERSLRAQCFRVRSINQILVMKRSNLTDSMLSNVV